MKQSAVDYACPVERRRRDDFKTPWDALSYYFKYGASVLGLFAVAFLLGLVTGLYMPNYLLGKKIESLKTEKERLCQELYGENSVVVRGLCAMKNGKVVKP